MSIFISIAAYEDPDLVNTIKSAMENARFPDDLIFGICLQYENEPDLSFLNKSQKRIISFDPEKRPGLVKARYLIKEMMFEEDYFFQIDSHTFFEKNWDVTLINLLRELKEINQNAIICAAPSRYNTNFRSCNVKWLIANEIPLTFNHIVTDSQPDENRFFKTQRFSGGGTFMDSNAAKNINYDRISHGQHEVTYLSFITFMSGYDMYDVYYCPFIHDNRNYNKLIYGDEDIRIKNFSTENYRESEKFLEYEFSKAFIYNKNSLFEVKNAKRKVEDFWHEIGFIDKFFELKSEYDKIAIEKGEEND